MQLSLSEQFILLLHIGANLSDLGNQDAIDCAVIGAVLMDLAFDFRIDTDLEALVVIDGSPTQNAALDRVLNTIAESPDNQRTQDWIQGLVREHSSVILEQTLAVLVARGILVLRKKRLLLQPSNRYLVREEQLPNEIHQRIWRLIDSEDIPDPEDVALISLLDGVDLLDVLFSQEEIRLRRPRIDQLRSMDLIGREVAHAIREIQRTVMQFVRARAAAFRRVLFSCSVITGIVSLWILFSPPIPFPESFGASWTLNLWLAETAQRVSGYTLLGLTALGFVIAVFMKRRFASQILNYHGWRLAHLGVGLACVALVFVHTGFRLGSNFNLALMICYLTLLVAGSLGGISSYAPSQFSRRVGLSKWRMVATWSHVIAFFFLPAFLIVHILTVYLY